MWLFQRIDPVQSVLPLKYVAFVGAGGKTSLIEYLAAGLTGMGKTVAITTTTKIYVREPYQLLNNNRTLPQQTVPLMRFGKTLEEGKLIAVDLEDIQRIGASYDIVLIEADGAKGKPLKYPAPYEPVIPSFSEKIYIVGGLDALYRKVREAVFRWELLRDSVGIHGDADITPDIFLSFFSPSILLKGIDTRKCSVVLNKFDTLGQRSCATNIARELLKKIEGLEVITSSINHCTFYMVTQLNNLQKNDLRFYNKDT